MDSNFNVVEVDSQKIYNELISDFEDSLGEPLYPADERRIFLNQQTQLLVAIKNSINQNAKQNFLRFASGDLLDALGELQDVKRIEAIKATVQCEITLSAIQNNNIIISKGKRITPDGKLFFELVNDTVIESGQTSIIATFSSTEAGNKFNNFVPGQIKNIVDPIAFVESIVNISTSTGGADKENDNRLRERIRLAPKSFSTAGPEGAYIYWVKSTDANISDVYINSPAPGTVRLTILLNNGGIPDSDLLDKVDSVCNAKDKRPLTDKVEIVAAEVANYDINLTYYLDKQHILEETKFRKAIEGENFDCSSGAIREFINWQQEHLGKAINPDELRFIMQNAATYTTIDSKIYTAVRKIEITNPVFTEIEPNQVAKLLNITVNYGGLE